MSKAGSDPRWGWLADLGRAARPHTTRAKGARIGYDFLHVAVDDRTRIAYAEAHPDERQETAVAFIGRAINWFADHGITVERVMTDNGTCYRSHAFANTLTAAGVGHLRTRPYRPQTNGKVERLNLTLKHEWAYVTAYPSNQARLDALAHWLHHYNHHRAHTALGGRPPISRVNNPPGSYS